MKTKNSKLSKPKTFPKIQKLELDPRTHLRVFRDKKCQQIIQEPGIAWHKQKQKSCKHFAQFKIGNKYLCALHAGQLALKHMYEEQEKFNLIKKSKLNEKE